MTRPWPVLGQPQKSQQTHHYHHTHTHKTHQSLEFKEKMGSSDSSPLEQLERWGWGNGGNLPPSLHPAVNGTGTCLEKEGGSNILLGGIGTCSQEQRGSGKKMWPKGAHLRFSASLQPTSHGWGLRHESGSKLYYSICNENIPTI